MIWIKPFAFWKIVIIDTDFLSINKKVNINIEEWKKQKKFTIIRHRQPKNWRLPSYFEQDKSF